MRYALVVLIASLGAAGRADQVDDLLAKMHAAYQKIHSVDMTVQSQIGNEGKHITETCRIQYMQPRLLHEVMTEKGRVGGVPSIGGFTYISDGTRLQTIGRMKDSGGSNGIKPYSAASVQDDGVPVYKETLCVWDWNRQWSGEKGGKASGFQYQINPSADWEGKKYIGLAEITPDHSNVFHYFVDPKTYLIKASVMYIPNEQGTDWQVVSVYDVKDMKVNPKLDKSLFVIKG